MIRVLFLCISLMFLNFSAISNPLKGAWKWVGNNRTIVLLFQDGYFVATSYTTDSFAVARGGTYNCEKNALYIQQEFNTAEKDLRDEKIKFSIKKNILNLDGIHYERIDNGNAKLSGVWKISERILNGKMTVIHQKGTRKTLKILTGTRFQWFAIDPDGNQFLGSGGGTYSFKDGIYTEKIEFFSRDSNRVGASLSFKGALKNARWHHSGLSSKGDPIYEIWEQVFTH
ncbi:MAG TPA: hypothetical protein VLZ83_13660 [Edaphocola sp.]|nr:hypothetical protein [Edaphocola sp.]